MSKSNFIGVDNGEDLPEVSVIVPIRNEEDHIGECLNSILENDYPADKLEVIVVDGESTDRSREIVQGFIEESEAEVRLLNNPKKIVPNAMNTGIEAANGEVIIRVDGHSYVADDFIPTSVRTLLEKEQVDAVGGPVRPVIDEDTTYLQRSISLALDSLMASGSSRFSGEKGYVTTVSFGAYRADAFERYGNFDERFVRSQDYELNYRMNSEGGKIFMNPEIKSYYYPRDSLFNLFSQYFQFGFWKTKVMKKFGTLLSVRNILPSFFLVWVLCLGLLSPFFLETVYLLLISLGGYLLTGTYFSFREVKKSGKYFHLLGVLMALVTIHVSFGSGLLRGLFVDLQGHFTLPWRGLNHGL